MPTPDSHNPFLEILHASTKVDPGALVTLWANLPPHPPGFTGDLFERFGDIDRDGDGFISRDELDRSCSSHRFKGNHAAALAALRAFLGKVQWFSDDEIGIENDGITRADLAGLDLAAQADPKNEVVVGAQREYEAAKRKLARSPRTVFVDEERPSIDPMVCEQGRMGDCYFLAPLIAMAMHGRRVQSMIRKHPEIPGAWRVYFGGARDAITVGAPTDAEIALFASADGLWPIIFEKAYGMQMSGTPYAALSNPVSSIDDPALEGDVVGPAIAILTGNDVDQDEMGVTRKSTTRSKLIEAIGGGKVVVAETPWQVDSRKWTAGGLRRSHAYSIVNFDARSDTVYARNPWGDDTGGLRNAEISQGFFKMPLEAAHDNFISIYYER